MIKRCIATLGISTVALAFSSSSSYAMENGMITASVLNIRSEPSTSKSVVCKVNKGEYVEILEKGSGWYKVKLSNGKIGWASAQYISIKPNSNSSQILNKKGKVSTSVLNIRNGFGTNYSVISKVNKNTYVDILDKSSNGWYKVKLSNGTVGWASGDYIILEDSSIQELPQIEDSTIIKYKMAKVNAVKLNIRSGAGTNYSVLYKVDKDTILELLEKTNNGWYKVKLDNGIIGWASSSYLYEITSNSSNDSVEDSSIEKDIISYVYSLLGTPYEWGGLGPNSFDCSGFTQYVYKQVKGKMIPRVSKEQAQYGQEVDKKYISAGDLVCFDTDGDGIINHVGIYLGMNEFIHCSGTPSKPDKVKISDLSTDYWSGVLKCIRRF